MFLFLRFKLTPYSQMIRHLPRRGKILDLGAGHGLLSLMMAYLRPSCEVLGVDHDSQRVQDATHAASGLSHLRFKEGDLREFSGDSEYEGITLIDTLHYFAPLDQESIVQSAFRSLKEGGVFLLREVDRTEGVRGFFNRLYERAATWTGFTRSKESSLSFRTPREWADLLRGAGFSVSWSRCSSILFSDVLFVARKESSLPANDDTLSNLVCVTADDWGMTPAINRGILNLAKRGLIRKVSILICAPFTEYLLDELRAIPGIELGLHFNLTYRSWSKSPLMLLLASKNPFKNHRVWQSGIRAEFERQLDRCRELGLAIKHVDGHHHAHIYPGVLEAILPSAQAYGIREMRLPADPEIKRFSPRVLLLWMSKQAKPLLDQAGIHYRPCYYPNLNQFKDAEELRRNLLSRPGYEIITHPADENDLAQNQCEDRYRHQRVIEYQTISQCVT